VTRVQREPNALVVEFDAGFDRQALDQALAVERECCPFFRFAVDKRRRSVRVTVGEAEQLLALDAIAHAFEATYRDEPRR
jgi:hypothetical protein